MDIKSQLTSSLEGSQDLVGRINHVMSSMQMLALNASIEASKVGVHGRGFAVVAEHMTKSVDNVRKLTEDIGKVNNDIRLVSDQIDKAISRLQ
jgi:methyl-accepting chemotaxis protein